MSTEKSAEHWTRGLASMLWPAFAFCILAGFWRPLHDIADRLPDVVDRSQTIGIASLRIELDAGTRRQRISPEASKALTALYADDIRLILRSPDTPLFASPLQIDQYRARYAHLIALGLVVEKTASMNNDAHSPGGSPARQEGWTFHYTEVGKEAKTHLVEVIVNLFSGAKQATH